MGLPVQVEYRYKVDTSPVEILYSLLAGSVFDLFCRMGLPVQVMCRYKIDISGFNVQF